MFGALDSAVFTVEFNGNLAGITIPATATRDLIGFGTAVPFDTLFAPLCAATIGVVMRFFMFPHQKTTTVATIHIFMIIIC